MHNTPGQEINWISRARQGDQRAFEYLVDAYQGPVFNLCRRMLGNNQLAEDAAQEVFYKTFRSLHRYDPNRALVNWILSIASHHCIDQLRKSKVITLPLYHAATQEEKAGSGPEEIIIEQEWLQNCQALLNQLDPVNRAAIVLFYWYAYSQAEIAAALGLSISAIKSRMHRSRRQLAGLLSGQNTEQELNKSTGLNVEYSAA